MEMSEVASQSVHGPSTNDEGTSKEREGYYVMTLVTGHSPRGSGERDVVRISEERR